MEVIQQPEYWEPSVIRCDSIIKSSGHNIMVPTYAGRTERWGHGTRWSSRLIIGFYVYWASKAYDTVELHILTNFRMDISSSNVKHNVKKGRKNKLKELNQVLLIMTGSVGLSAHGLKMIKNKAMRWYERDHQLTKRFRCSMNTCKLTSSVKMACPFAPGALPYMLVDIWVVDGLSLERRKRAWLPPWSQTMYRGMGNLSAKRSCGM